MPNILDELNVLVAALVARSDVSSTIGRLRGELRTSQEPFVWAALDLQAMHDRVPAPIRSGWIFVLQQDRWSGAHFHPNSVQHMTVIDGRGRSKIAGVMGELTAVEPADAGVRQWCVIDQGVAHEFCPAQSDMVVMSFHTCDVADLIEVASATGAVRRYET